MPSHRHQAPNLKSMLKQIQTAVGHSCEWIGLRYTSDDTRTIVAKNGKYDYSGEMLLAGIMVEVMFDGQIAYSATADLSSAGILRATESAIKWAKLAAPFRIFNFTVEQRPKAVGHYISPHLKGLDKLSYKEILDTLIQTSERLKCADEIIYSHAYSQLAQRQMHFVSTNGSDFQTEILIGMTDLQATAMRAGESQTRTHIDGLKQQGLESMEREKFLHIAERVSCEALELLSAPNCPSDTRDLLIMPDQTVLQLHESIGHPLELDRILGDERNYAGHSHVKLSDFGKLQYGSKLLNVTYGPTHPNALASFQFDDGGAEATKEYLIKDGLLVRAIGGAESQARAKVPGVACFRSSLWNRAPIDRMGNINLEAGDSSLAEMVKATQKGIIMRTNRSWSIDDYRRKFQFGCEYAQLIEDGRITTTVKNPNYRGISVPFWNSLKMVGNQSTVEALGTFGCGKGEPNQGIYVGHVVPACLLENVE